MFIAVVSIFSALIGGWLGWRRGTVNLYSRSFDPLHAAHSDSEPDDMARRRRGRLMRTAIYAMAGPVVAFGTLFVLVRN